MARRQQPAVGALEFPADTGMASRLSLRLPSMDGWSVRHSSPNATSQTPMLPLALAGHLSVLVRRRKCQCISQCSCQKLAQGLASHSLVQPSPLAVASRWPRVANRALMM